MKMKDLYSGQKLDKREDCLKEVALAVSKFLKENGGYANGYETWVDGDIRYNTTQYLKWRTPAFRDLTQRFMDGKGLELNEILVRILQKYSFNDYMKISAEFIEDGCYETRVSFSVTERVNLPY